MKKIFFILLILATFVAWGGGIVVAAETGTLSAVANDEKTDEIRFIIVDGAVTGSLVLRYVSGEDIVSSKDDTKVLQIKAGKPLKAIWKIKSSEDGDYKLALKFDEKSNSRVKVDQVLRDNQVISGNSLEFPSVKMVKDKESIIEGVFSFASQQKTTPDKK